MFRLIRGRTRDCEGVTRREFLRVGGLGLAGLTLADLLRLESRARRRPRPARSVILLWMQGGPSHIDTLRPQARRPGRDPRRVRGDPHHAARACRSASTLPMLARHLDKFAIIRRARPEERRPRRPPTPT